MSEPTPDVQQYKSDVSLQLHIQGSFDGIYIVCTADRGCISSTDHYTVIALTLSCMSSHRSSTSTELLTAATVQVSSDNQSLNSGNPENTYSDIISSSVHNITVIGVYMVIFAIAGNLMCSYFSGDACTIISTYLEIGSGVPVLYSMDISTKIKTALILSLTAFGGLSALFQSRDMIRISGLSFIKYTTGKIVCAFLCFIFYMMCL